MMNDDDILETDGGFDEEEDLDEDLAGGDDLEEDGMTENISEDETADM